MRQWNRCPSLSKFSQAIRFGICFVACIFLFYPLSAAITLQDPSPTDVAFVLVEGGERSSPQEVIIAELYVLAKHRGMGRVHISYSPLTDGTTSVLYQMVRDDGRQIGGGFCADYVASSRLRRTYRICSLKALLSRSLREEETNLRSTITLELSVEL
nr:hypothetical protein [uncultured Sphaerochaeta sp.]